MPWGISHKYKFIFIHIPKTAGTTICSSWEGSLLKKICKETGVLGGTHKSAVELQEMFPAEFGSYTKWTVIRNPYDRFVSKFFFKQLEKRKDFSLQWTDKESEGLLPQVYWITDKSLPWDILDQDVKDPYFRPDTRYGNFLIKRRHMLKYENLNSELKNLFAELGIPWEKGPIPHFRQTRTVGDYMNYYPDERWRSLVRFIYREDFARLGYDA